MRSKIIHLAERFAKTGEPTVQPVILWGHSGRPCYERLTKEASASPALDYIRTITPVPGRSVVLILGLGSFEWYGLNRNADGFNEQPYKIGQKPTCGCCGNGRDAWVLENECVTHHYSSYEQGNVFRHHVNKDPKKAVGKVLKSFWNPYMHRVEVLEDIDHGLAADLAEQIADGEYPAKSMGCRIKFDVCTQCGHQAPTRKQYCDHLKWQLNYLDPKTGIRYGALNPSPNFFDSSWVTRPADRTGYMLKKVADDTSCTDIRTSSELGDLVDDLQNKAAMVKKLAVIDKVVRGYPAGLVGQDSPDAGLLAQYAKVTLPTVTENTQQLSHEDLQTLAPYPFAQVLAALSRAGILLTTPEFVQLFAEKAHPGVVIPPRMLENMCALQGEVFEFLGKNPSLLNQLMETLSWPEGNTNTELDKVVAPLMEKRSNIPGYLYRRMLPDSYKMQEAPRSELMTVTDPHTGAQYQTTQGAAWNAEDQVAKSQLKYLGGSALSLMGAHRAMSLGKLNWGLPLLAGGAMMANEGIKHRPVYKSDTGAEVPYLTEFTQKYSHYLDKVNACAQDHGFTKTGCATFNRVVDRAPNNTYFGRIIHKLASFGLQNGDVSLDNLLTPYKTASDGITEEPIAMEKVAEILGALIVELL